MRYVVDLHSHSGYAGGVGDISLPVVAETMAQKGINAFGVGDCLQPAWNERLDALLSEAEPGLFRLRDAGGVVGAARFVMQTEVIITSPAPGGGRKITHLVLLFPGFSAAREAIRLLLGWGVKVDMGRPFVKCVDAADVAEKCTALRAIDDSVMLIPAHVMTPQGVYGSERPVGSLREVFGEFADRITTVETGLSADPALLAMLPELDNRTMISSSDCHSGALNRVGREFTALELDQPSYAEIVRALRGRKIRYTAEFNPAEGRFFLTGHRAGLERHGKSYCYYSPGLAPQDGLCPICGKPLTVGVLERLLELSREQAGDGRPRRLEEVESVQAMKTLVPLVEVIAAGLGVKSVTGKKISGHFLSILEKVGTEANLWELPETDIRRLFTGGLPDAVLEAVVSVRNGDFSFQPGYDGNYGVLHLGRKIDWFTQNCIATQDKI